MKKYSFVLVLASKAKRQQVTEESTGEWQSGLWEIPGEIPRGGKKILEQNNTLILTTPWLAVNCCKWVYQPFPWWLGECCHQKLSSYGTNLYYTDLWWLDFYEEVTDIWVRWLCIPGEVGQGNLPTVEPDLVHIRLAEQTEQGFGD